MASGAPATVLIARLPVMVLVVPVRVLMTVMALPMSLPVQTWVPSGVMAIASGSRPTWMLRVILLVVVATIVTASALMRVT